MSKLTHVNSEGKVNMVDVGQKSATQRMAKASCNVEMPSDVVKHLIENGHNTPKGSVLQTAIIAGIMGAKKTGDLIPLCHPIGMDNCDVSIEQTDFGFKLSCTTSVFAKTGIEMEALTGVTVAALCIYDMCKALSHDIRITNVQLEEKRGGKKDFIR